MIRLEEELRDRRIQACHLFCHKHYYKKIQQQQKQENAQEQILFSVLSNSDLVLRSSTEAGTYMDQARMYSDIKRKDTKNVHVPGIECNMEVKKRQTELEAQVPPYKF